MKKGRKNIWVLYTGKELRQRRRETILNPPAGIFYKTQSPISNMNKDHRLSNPKKKSDIGEFALKFVDLLRIPNIRYLPKKYLEGVDLVHTPGQLILNKVPWIVEIDNSSCVSFYRLKTLKSPISGRVIRLLLKSKYCKKIICMSEAAKKSMINTFNDEKINEKLEVSYPYVRLNPYKKKKSNKIKLLFISTNFYANGGADLVKAFNILTKKYKNLELIFVTKKAFIESILLEDCEKQGNIKFYEAKYDKDQLYRQFYSQVDIYVEPTYKDSFGLVFLEAVASGLPIIATDMFALPEIVEEGKNGFLLKCPIPYFREDYTPNKDWWYFDVGPVVKTMDFPEIVSGLVEKLSILIENKKLREEMGKYSLNLVKKGKFSDKKRKENLKRIYQESLY